MRCLNAAERLAAKEEIRKYRDGSIDVDRLAENLAQIHMQRSRSIGTSRLARFLDRRADIALKRGDPNQAVRYLRCAANVIRHTPDTQ